jgi:hypothetical protein
LPPLTGPGIDATAPVAVPVVTVLVPAESPVVEPAAVPNPPM